MVPKIRDAVVVRLGSVHHMHQSRFIARMMNGGIAPCIRTDSLALLTLVSRGLGVRSIFAEYPRGARPVTPARALVWLLGCLVGSLVVLGDLA